MKKQIIIATALIAGLAAYTAYTTKALTAEREKFVKACEANRGIYAEGVLTDMDWETGKNGKGMYLLKFTKHDLEKPTKATLPGVKADLDKARRKLEKGKSYAVCMKQDHVLIDYYKSF